MWRTFIFKVTQLRNNLKCTQTSKSILATLEAINFCIFLQGMKNHILLVCDILCCPVINSVMQLPIMILVDAYLIFIPRLTLQMTCRWAFRPEMSLYLTSLICHTLTICDFEVFSKITQLIFNKFHNIGFLTLPIW